MVIIMMQYNYEPIQDNIIQCWIIAAQEGDLETIKKLYQKNPGILSVKWDGLDAFDYASQNKRAEIVKFLTEEVSKQQNINPSANQEREIFIQDDIVKVWIATARNGELKQLEELYLQNPNLIDADWDGTALNYAVKFQKLEIIGFLLKKINLKDQIGLNNKDLKKIILDGTDEMITTFFRSFWAQNGSEDQNMYDYLSKITPLDLAHFIFPAEIIETDIAYVNYCVGQIYFSLAKSSSIETNFSSAFFVEKPKKDVFMDYAISCFKKCEDYLPALNKLLMMSIEKAKNGNEENIYEAYNNTFKILVIVPESYLIDFSSLQSLDKQSGGIMTSWLNSAMKEDKVKSESLLRAFEVFAEGLNPKKIFGNN